MHFSDGILDDNFWNFILGISQQEILKTLTIQIILKFKKGFWKDPLKRKKKQALYFFYILWHFSQNIVSCETFR